MSVKKDLNAAHVLLSGDEALAQGAYEAGVKVAASYPGTPATEILEYMSKFDEVDCQWSVNEKVAYEVAYSSAVAGVRALFSAKHVGLNVAMDAIMTSAYTGINAGFVVVTCDEPGLHSSQNEQDNRLLAKMAKLPLIEPSSPSEAKEFVKEAFEISEKFDTPVILRLTTRIAHTKETVRVEKRQERSKKHYQPCFEKYVMVPKNAGARHAELEKRIAKLKKYSGSSSLNAVEIGDRKIGFITSGVSYLYAKEMYPDASFLKLGMSYPFPEDKVREFVKKVKTAYVIEELEPFIEEQCKIAGIKIKTKDESFRVGELRPEHIPLIIAGDGKKDLKRISRKPVLCPGCSHRPVFWVLNKLKLNVAGDIGCYTLGASAPLSALHTCLCMGSGDTILEGFTKVLGRNVVGVMGDSTFVHSGITGLINLAYNKTNTVLIILDNSTTGMTGSQPHPATGITIKGERTKKLVLEDICRAAGADNVDVIDPFKIKELESLIKKRTSEDKLSVIISRFPCRLVERRKSSAPLFLKDRCKKCGLCLKLDCPSIKKEEDGSVLIDTVTCVGCNLCVDVCPFGAILKND